MSVLKKLARNRSAVRHGRAALVRQTHSPFGNSVLRAAMWIIPANRMKAGKEHRIPLSPTVLALLQSLIPITPKGKLSHVVGHVFPGVKDRPLTTAAAMNLLKELHPSITAHGFRSTFRDWAAETTKHPREVIEAAMAHRLKDKSEAAYQRGDLLTRRAKLMNDWVRYCRSYN